MFKVINDILNLADESIALNRLKRVNKGYITADGYRYAVLPNGKVSDGDMTWNTEREFFSSVGYLNIVQLKDSELDKLKSELKRVVKHGYSDFLF